MYSIIFLTVPLEAYYNVKLRRRSIFHFFFPQPILLQCHHPRHLDTTSPAICVGRASSDIHCANGNVHFIFHTFAMHTTLVLCIPLPSPFDFFPRHFHVRVSFRVLQDFRFLQRYNSGWLLHFLFTMHSTFSFRPLESIL